MWGDLSCHCQYLDFLHKQQNLAGILGFPLEVFETCPDIPAPDRSESAKEIGTKSLWTDMTKTKVFPPTVVMFGGVNSLLKQL